MREAGYGIPLAAWPVDVRVPGAVLSARGVRWYMVRDDVTGYWSGSARASAAPGPTVSGGPNATALACLHELRSALRDLDTEGMGCVPGDTDCVKGDTPQP